MKKQIRRAVVLCTLILMTITLTVSCGGAADTAGNGDAAQQQVYRWRLQSWAPAGDATYEAAQALAEKIRIASNGQLLITTHTAGSIIPGGSEFDAVMDGSVEAVHGPPTWTIGYVPAAVFFTQYPGGLTANQMETWMNYEGNSIAQEIYDPFGVHFVGILTLSPAEVWAHSNRRLTSVDDIRGLKFRLGSTALNEVFSRMGATPVFLPGGEIYEAAQRGVIDALEYITPSINWGMGFHEVTDYMYLGPSRAPLDVQALYVNDEAWDELPPHLKEIVTLATHQASREYYAVTLARDAEAMPLYEDAGQVIEFVPDDIVELLNEKSIEYFSEESAKDPEYARIFQLHRDWQTMAESFNVY